jgi:iron complex transport system substrate-binding protein
MAAMRSRPWFFTTASCKAVFFSALLALPCAVSAEWLRATDDRGKEVALSAPAQRIVTLAPNLAELVFAAGAGKRLVGVSAYSDFPAAVRILPQIGGFGKVDLERLLQLRPDLVIAWRSGNAPGDLARLEKLGIPLYVTEARRLDDIPRQIETIGRLAGTASQAEPVAAAFRYEVQQLEYHYANGRAVRVFYQIWHQPLMTVNGQHLIGEVMRLCGGVNPYASLPALTPTVSMESLLAANPAVIVVNGDTSYWQRCPQLEAVRRGQVFSINPDFLHRATPRLLEGARQLCAVLEQARR